MATDLNNVSLTGRLTRQAEIRYGQAGGGAIVRFSIAVNRRKRTADGQAWEDETSFIDCVYFGKAAESVHSYLDKGRQVAISGELRQSRWEQDGQQRSRLEVIVNTLVLLSSGRGQDGAMPNQVPNQNYSNNSFARPSQNSYNNYGSDMSQNRTSGSFSRANAPIEDSYDVGGPESYGDDDVPF